MAATTRRMLIRGALTGSFAGGCLPMILSSSKAATPSVAIKLGSSGGPPNPPEVAIDKWAQAVAQESQGKIAVEVFHNGTLGNEKALLIGTRSNAIQMGACSNANLDSFTDAMEVFELPYLLRDANTYFRVWDSDIGNRVRSNIEKKLGIRILMLLDAGGFRSILAARKEIRTPVDLKGLKLRIAFTPVELDTFKYWGVDPVALSNSEQFMALQEGTVDGVVLQPTWINSDKLYEVAKKICDIHYAMYSYVVYINSDFFNKLPQDFQHILTRLSAQQEVAERQAVATAIASSKRHLIASGVEWYTPTTKERAEWKAAAKPIWRMFEPKLGKDLIERVEKMASA